MRSKPLWLFHSYVSELNTHYSHFLFIAQEFINQNNKNSEMNLDSETKDIFGQNIYATQFNVKLRDLPMEYEGTKQFILRSLFLLTYFQFEIYLRDMYFFLKSFSPDMPELTQKIAVITQLNNFKVLSAVDVKSLQTIEYLKLRRNAVVHRDESHVAQGELNEFTKQNGKALNDYWQKIEKDKKVENGKKKLKVPKIKKLDFSFQKDTSLYRFTDDEVIDILNLMRYLSEAIDKCFLNQIGLERFKKFIVDEFDNVYKEKENSKHQFLDNESRQRKLHHYLMMFYGISENEFSDNQG